MAGAARSGYPGDKGGACSSRWGGDTVMEELEGEGGGGRVGKDEGRGLI